MKKIILLLSALIITILASGCIGQQISPTTTTLMTTVPKTTTTAVTKSTAPITTVIPTTAPQEKTVAIKTYSFNPSTLTVKVGTKVTWTNEDTVSHTVTSDSGNELSSGQLSQGQSYSHTFNQVGTYNYHCSIHYSMTGTVIVEQ
jgi:plastocyanin